MDHAGGSGQDTSCQRQKNKETKKTLYKEVEKEIRKLHAYDVPEIYAEEIKEGL
ncbi:MAG TPA: divalent-cation tolerance protein CutA [Candidatus Blautia pullicola]|uniref:Divalent-cation tolerance protein CutA n=1 Tax=Candidatus Blautia pullicola TaxID=2838498 RepID=A0A9D2FSS1_9FIRM|nr:divalent-cation tolerance protein CutA [Candidatus Blautia pullicola]